MANRTVKDARSIKGTNPQYLVEKITRSRIYESRYWKEECFALSAELLVDKAMELRYVGGTYGGNIKPSPFLCLLLKMLQIQPEKDIIIEFIKNEDFKYVRCLGATYMRLIGESLDVYKYLEPLYNDYRKVRRQDKEGAFYLSHVDEFIDELLHEERVCDIILPRVQKRHVLEETEQLEPRVSPLEEDLDDMEEESSEGEMEMPDIQRSPERHRGSYHDYERPRRSPSPRYRRSRSRSPRRRRSPSPRRRSPSPRRERRRSRSPRRDRARSRSRERDRRHRSPGRNYHHDRDDRHHHRHRSVSPDDRHRRSHRK
ncbi:pre-mRNA-splicing factor 38A-like [Diadema antillarum]|uniref:pre-mRNA-splicing factor 38A-like n=1 Tax=Diadema antillarum TaxID=105358 RepID=UPI003A842D22